MRKTLPVTVVMAILLLAATALGQTQRPWLPAGAVAADNTTVLPHGHVKGWVLLIHGGGWIFVGQPLVQAELPYAHWFAHHGWAVNVIDYRPGFHSLPDTLAAYDQLRRRHPDARICADGASAGGQLAMMLAALRPRLNCVISEAGIADLRLTRGNVRIAAAASFDNRLWRFSPLRLARRIGQPLLLAGARCDPVIGETQQLREMKRGRPQTATMLLPCAPTPNPWVENFPHFNVTALALTRFRARVLRMLQATTASRSHRRGSRHRCSPGRPESKRRLPS